MIGMRKQHHRHSQKVTRTARWKVLRMAILERDGFRCKGCGCGGRLEVDHIKPVRTDPELSFDPDNLQALCPACHTRKTRLECGHQPMPEPRREWNSFVLSLQTGKPNFTIPQGLRPSAVPVFMVCGPPGAGKSTLIRDRAAPQDLIIDFDVYLKVLGGEKWTTDKDMVRKAFAMRNDALRSLAGRRTGRVWFIKMAPTQTERAAWGRALLRVTDVMVATDPTTCKARIRADPDRQHAVEKMCSAVDDWWTAYAADSGQTRMIGENHA